MVKKVLALCCALTFGLFIALPAPSHLLVQAQTKGEQKLIVEPDGTTYLSTEAEDGTVVLRRVDRATAQGTVIVPPRTFARDFGTLLSSLLRLAFVISALLVLFFLIVAGIEYITSGGDKGKTEKAREKIVAAIIGIIIVSASYAIFGLALQFFGVSSVDELFAELDTINTITLPASPSPSPDATTSGDLTPLL